MQDHLPMRWPFRRNASSNKEEARRHYNSKITTKQSLLEAMLSDNPNDLWALDVLEVVHEHCSPWRRLRSSCNEPSPLTCTNTSDVSFTPDASVATAQSWCALLPRSLGHRPMKSYALMMFETFGMNNHAGLFPPVNLGPGHPFPIFVQAKERFESGDVEGGIELPLIGCSERS